MLAVMGRDAQEAGLLAHQGDGDPSAVPPLQQLQSGEPSEPKPDDRDGLRRPVTQAGRSQGELGVFVSWQCSSVVEHFIQLSHLGLVGSLGSNPGPFAW